MYQPLNVDIEAIGKQVVQAAYTVHKAMGPGLLEKVYETCMIHELTSSGIIVNQQQIVPLYYKGEMIQEKLRLDLIVADSIIVELKSVDQIHPVHEAQIISYLKLSNLQLGYLINFNVPLIKSGIKRFRV
jgi:GxxExxY protein